MGDYLVANNGQLPNDILALKEYINSQTAVTDSMLSHYQLLHSGNVGELQQNEPLIAEQGTNQNGQYDALFMFGAFDWSSRRVVPLGGDRSGSIFPRNPDMLKKLFKVP